MTGREKLFLALFAAFMIAQVFLWASPLWNQPFIGETAVNTASAVKLVVALGWFGSLLALLVSVDKRR